MQLISGDYLEVIVIVKRYLEPAELVIENVTVITMDPWCPFATGVAISKGKIVGLIHGRSGWPLAPGGQRLDGEGTTLLPGLIDAHCHLRALLSSYHEVRCSRTDVRSINDIILAVHYRAKRLPAGSWIRASGYDPYYLREKRHPTRWDLDIATVNHPVRLRHVTRHASVLNSAALEAAGIRADTPDPPGVMVERELDTGVPTGRIFGGDKWLSQHIIPPMSAEELKTGVEFLQTVLLGQGITAVQDATPTNTWDDLVFWKERMAEGWPISVLLMSDEKHHMQMRRFLEQDSSRRFCTLEVGPIKIVMENSMQLQYQLNELYRIVELSVRQGVSLAFHAVEPEMIWAVIDLVRYARQAEQTDRYKKKKLYRIEHLSLCPEAFLPDLARLKVFVVTNPGFISEHGERYLEDVDIAEHGWLYRANSLLQAGVPLAAGSDAPVATVSPWIGMYAACTRKTMNGRPLNENERLNRWQALSLYTTGAAKAAGWERERGMIRTGFRADLVALNQNPLVCPIDELKTIQVKATWIGGQLVYKSK